MTANKHDFGEPWVLRERTRDHEVIDRDGVCIMDNVTYYPTPVCNEDMQRCVETVNACAGLSVANGEMERLLEAVNETLKHESGNGYQPWIVNLRTALNALLATAAASPAVAKQIDEFIKDVDA